MIDGAPEHLLRGHVVQRPHERAVLRHRGPFDAGDTEVENPDDTVPIDHDVGGLDVPVHDARAMREVEAGADLLEVRNLVGERQRSPRTDDLGERFAVDKLHRHVRLVVVLAARVDRDDVRVAQCGGGACLAEKPVEDLLVADLLANHLDRHLAAQFRVAAEVDGAHPAGADLAEDFEVSDARRNVGHDALCCELPTSCRFRSFRRQPPSRYPDRRECSPCR